MGCPYIVHMEQHPIPHSPLVGRRRALWDGAGRLRSIGHTVVVRRPGGVGVQMELTMSIGASAATCMVECRGLSNVKHIDLDHLAPARTGTQITSMGKDSGVVKPRGLNDHKLFTLRAPRLGQIQACSRWVLEYTTNVDMRAWLVKTSGVERLSCNAC